MLSLVTPWFMVYFNFSHFLQLAKYTTFCTDFFCSFILSGLCVVSSRPAAAG